jgi:predicted small metal-binding protein
MKKSLSCKDVGSDCDFVICGKTKDEIFDKAKEHARKEHGLSEFTQEFKDWARSAIRDVERC